MSELRELYQELVLDHGKHPRNFHGMEDADRQSVGYNPLCGDKLTLYLKLEGDTVKDVSFQGAGCAISTASASLLTETLKGRTRAEVDQVIREFIHMLTEGSPDDDVEHLGKLVVFQGVREFPVRVKCATLAWRTLEAALHGQDEPVTTE
ncbi:MAG: SUF system NifU family Fe-S cluster assembly protein [Candidatus Eisenbacteria bacterium]|uniref:SUF system NifU family Fe-S cluster assembly protein n=1 Tax=Eiseniibacteriota bacterium TaxID=2212470 RepID=A0A956ND66_UNCEI|nr:SUF system NifU family Fe-S cluster assembly protein [Candidatus Eisenbacteria bacterium]MCB9465967.1 SUF system NifU family Fe-S cluster assembly protein [Candidatus Eisenbacteria bacterium]